MTDYSGNWTGIIRGDSSGTIGICLRQTDNDIEGEAGLLEGELHTEYSVRGTAAEDLRIILTPHRRLVSNFEYGVAEVNAALDQNGDLIGGWRPTLGSWGTIHAVRYGHQRGTKVPDGSSVFIVHGHDEGTMHTVARILEKAGMRPVIMNEQIDGGNTVIEKYEELAETAKFAIILMTPDDIGYATDCPNSAKYRARQNVILEMGYFLGRLGRSKVLVLTKGDVEMPSDFLGVLCHPIDKSDNWKFVLARELNAQGYSLDLSRIIR